MKLRLKTNRRMCIVCVHERHVLFIAVEAILNECIDMAHFALSSKVSGVRCQASPVNRDVRAVSCQGLPYWAPFPTVTAYFFAVAIWSNGTTVQVLDLGTGQCTRTLKGHTGQVCAVAVTSDSRHIVTGSYDKTACVWDLAKGKCTLILNGHKYVVMAVTGSHDDTARVWDLATWQCTRALGCAIAM